MNCLGTSEIINVYVQNFCDKLNAKEYSLNELMLDIGFIHYEILRNNLQSEYNKCKSDCYQLLLHAAVKYCGVDFNGYLYYKIASSTAYRYLLKIIKNEMQVSTEVYKYFQDYILKKLSSSDLTSLSKSMNPNITLVNNVLKKNCPPESIINFRVNNTRNRVYDVNYAQQLLMGS